MFDIIHSHFAASTSTIGTCLDSNGFSAAGTNESLPRGELYDSGARAGR